MRFFSFSKGVVHDSSTRTGPHGMQYRVRIIPTHFSSTSKSNLLSSWISSYSTTLRRSRIPTSWKRLSLLKSSIDPTSLETIQPIPSYEHATQDHQSMAGWLARHLCFCHTPILLLFLLERRHGTFQDFEVFPIPSG